MPSGIILYQLYVDTKDVAKKWRQLVSAFAFVRIDYRRGFHIIRGLTNRVIVNSTTAFNIIQEMPKDRVKQLNRRCDACSRFLYFVAAVIDGVGDLGFRVC